MSEAIQDEEDIEEPSPALIYIAGETPERRRRWCVNTGCYYFGGPARKGALTKI